MIQIEGTTGTIRPRSTPTVLDMDGDTFDTVLIAIRPDEIDYNPLGRPGGQYRLARVTSELSGASMGTGAVVFSARWGNPTGYAVITMFESRFLPLGLQTGILTDATSFDLYVARTFTVPPIGGTPLLSGSPMDSRCMPPSQFSDMRIALNTRLFSGTFTPDPHAIAGSLRSPEYQKMTGTEQIIHPWADDISLFFGGGGGKALVLTQNEGLLLVNRSAWGVSGSGRLLVEMAWEEGPFG